MDYLRAAEKLNVTHSEQAGAQRGSDSINGFLLIIVCLQISSLCTEEAAAQEQTGQVEECLKINLLKLKKEGCKKVKQAAFTDRSDKQTII